MNLLKTREKSDFSQFNKIKVMRKTGDLLHQKVHFPNIAWYPLLCFYQNKSYEKNKGPLKCKNAKSAKSAVSCLCKVVAFSNIYEDF